MDGNDNDTRTGDEETHATRMVIFPRGATVFAAVCAICFIVIGVLGNFITILALSKCNKLRNATTAFVISLCAADLLFCSINLPLIASPHNAIYDKIYQKRNIALMISFVWVFSFAMMAPPLAGVWGRLGYNAETFSCTILSSAGKSPKKFLFVLGFLLPFIVIVVSYSCIYYKVRQSRQNVAAHSPCLTKAHQRKDDIRLTRLMFVIFCSFIGCYLPLMLVNVFDEDDTRYPVLHVLASVLAWASSCINPFIYAVMSRQYRNAYSRLLRFKSKGSRSRSTSSSRSNSGKTATTDVFAFNQSNNVCKKQENGNTKAPAQNV
uniref:G-protein coupled receptors family 1 profile domain-containing protein n=1 Tax=Strigamia maritima TaxID=126957 RepID=T1JFL2_STRMM